MNDNHINFITCLIQDKQVILGKVIEKAKNSDSIKSRLNNLLDIATLQSQLRKLNSVLLRDSLES
jgi:hypothetical protein